MRKFILVTLSSLLMFTSVVRAESSSEEYNRRLVNLEENKKKYKSMVDVASEYETNLIATMFELRDWNMFNEGEEQEETKALGKFSKDLWVSEFRINKADLDKKIDKIQDESNKENPYSAFDLNDIELVYYSDVEIRYYFDSERDLLLQRAEVTSECGTKSTTVIWNGEGVVEYV